MIDSGVTDILIAYLIENWRDRFYKGAWKELAKTDIQVNCITPAVIATDILGQLTEEAVHHMISKIPMGRTGKPEKVAAMVTWLCSSECSFSTVAVFDISGAVLHIENPLLMRRLLRVLRCC